VHKARSAHRKQKVCMRQENELTRTEVRGILLIKRSGWIIPGDFRREGREDAISVASLMITVLSWGIGKLKHQRLFLMKICHLSSVHDLHDTRILYKECASLAEAGNDVHLIVRHDHDEVINGVTIHGVRGSRSKTGRLLRTVPAVYSKAREIDPDVCHIHDIELVPLALMLKYLHGKTIVYDVHEDNPETVLSRKVLPRALRKPVSLAVRLVEKLSAPLFDAVVTVTPTILERFKNYTPRTHLIRNFPIISDDAQAPTSWENRRDAVIYVGSIARYRGIVTMLEGYGLAREKHEIEYILAGRFASRDDEEFIRSMPVFDHVDYRGFVERAAADALMSSAKAGLVVIPPDPRYMVSYPTKMFEYMAAGMPVIASDFPVWREIVEESSCGFLVDPLDPNSVAEAIARVFDNQAEAEAMGKRGRDAALRTYRWQTEKAALIELYGSFLTERRQ